MNMTRIAPRRRSSIGIVDVADLEPAAVEPTRPMTVGRIVGRAVGYGLFFSAIVIWFVFLRPVSLGGPMSVLGVSGHSMNPTFDPGDFIVARHITDYHVGDIIVYRIPAGDPGAGDRVVHRIVGGDIDTGFVMKGDNNANVDQWTPTRADIVGEVWLRIPNLAGWIMRLREPAVLAMVIGFVGFALMLTPDRTRTSMWRWIRK